MSRICCPSLGAADWRRHLADPARQWRAGYSAHAVAHSWENAAGLPPEIASALGPGAELLLAIPEHKVPLPGRGAASQCDVFALVRVAGGLCALAVEANVDEPFGPTVAEWLVDASPGKRERLAGLLAILELADVSGEVRYQLLHRTAAALIEARRFGAGQAAMLVQSFSPVARWREDFDRFAALFAPVAAPGGIALTLGWVSSPLPPAQAPVLPGAMP